MSEKGRSKDGKKEGREGGRKKNYDVVRILFQSSKMPQSFYKVFCSSFEAPIVCITLCN